MARGSDDDAAVREAYARGGRVAAGKYPSPRMSGTKFPTLKTGPAPRVRAAPRMPAEPDRPPLRPSQVFPVRSRSGGVSEGGGAARGNDAVPVGDGYSMADDDV